MTSRVLPAFSSKVTVVTAPPSSPSSLVQTRREFGITSMYLPKNSIGGESPWLKTKRYWPPTRTSASHETMVTPIDFGTHHCLRSSGLVHASNTIRAGPLMVRVTTNSRSDVRSIVVRLLAGVNPLSLFATIDFLLLFESLDNQIQFVEARVPEPSVLFEPRCLFLQATHAEPAGPYAPHLFRRDETGLLQDADVLHHARERHLELFGEVRNRGVGTPKLLQNTAPGGVRKRGKRGV